MIQPATPPLDARTGESQKPIPDPKALKQDELPPIPSPTSNLTKFALWGAMGLAFIGIVGGLVLCTVLLVKGVASNDVLMIRLLLSCVAVFVATAFGALGFALFLIKAEGAFKAQLADPGSSPRTLETTAPGLVVFVCAVVIMYLALHMNFSTGGEFVGPPPPTADQQTKPAAKPETATPAKPTQNEGPPLGGKMEKPW